MVCSNSFLCTVLLIFGPMSNFQSILALFKVEKNSLMQEFKEMKLQTFLTRKNTKKINKKTR